MNDPLDRAILALREETGVTEDGAVTGQRLESAWLRRQARGRALRKPVMLVVAILVLSGAALAATNLVRRVRPANPVPMPMKTARPASPPARPAPAAARPDEDAPVPAVAEPAVATPAVATPAASLPAHGRVTDTATSAYAAAHRAHFVDRNWSHALALWTRYLRLAPRGPLAPEASFNRALCLIRLDRLDDAAAELQPFARGRWGGYRQHEARRLLDSIAAPWSP
jgi:TolA-binding protein